MTLPPAPNLSLSQIAGTLPEDFEVLRQDALDEGFDHIERLAAEWASGVLRFEGQGEILLGARCDGHLAGIGGLSIETAVPQTLRLRRFYVRPIYRGASIGRAIADRLILHAKALGHNLTLNALTPQACAFWERLGFVPDARLGFSHRMVV